MSTSTEILFDVSTVEAQRKILETQYNILTAALANLSNCYGKDDPGFFLNKSGPSILYDASSGTYSSNLSSGSDLAVVGGSLTKLGKHLESIYEAMIVMIDAAIDKYGSSTARAEAELSALSARLSEIRTMRGGSGNE